MAAAARGRPRFAIVSRELFPFGGGGIGFYVTSVTRLLAELGEVKLFTTSLHRARYEELRAAGDPQIPPPDEVELVFVPEVSPAEVGGFYSPMHLYSSRVLDALREAYGERGPDLIEFSDYLGEGAVTVQARRTGDPLLARTLVAIRLHTSGEMCAVLDGAIGADFTSRATCALERLALRDADFIIWQGGDTLASYERFYGVDELAPARLIRYPYAQLGSGSGAADADAAAADPPRKEEPRAADTPLRLLYLGRLERRKGPQNLVTALATVDFWVDARRLRVKLVGGDTPTAPLGTSMATTLALMAANDARIEFLPSLSLEQLRAELLDTDAVVLPSLWEAWPYVALEALQANRPIIATPVGGFVEIVRPGASGWLTKDTTAESLAVLIEYLIFYRDEVDKPRLAGLPAAVFAELVEPSRILAAYAALLEEPGRWGATPAAPARSTRRVAAPSPPLVSVVIPYHRLADHVAATVVSAFAQTHRPLEVLVINDGSFEEEDWILAELMAEYPLTVLSQTNAGLGAARNFGITQSRGRYVLPLDADNVLEPTFVERTAMILERDPRIAFATSWSRYIDDDGAPLHGANVGFQPIGSRGTMIDTENVAGDAVALIRRWLFDAGFRYSEELTSYEDWDLYCRLARAGHNGVVIPERLFRYRVRENSMIRRVGIPHTARLLEEMAAGMREREVRWEFGND